MGEDAVFEVRNGDWYDNVSGETTTCTKCLCANKRTLRQSQRSCESTTANKGFSVNYVKAFGKCQDTLKVTTVIESQISNVNQLIRECQCAVEARTTLKSLGFNPTHRVGDDQVARK